MINIVADNPFDKSSDVIIELLLNIKLGFCGIHVVKLTLQRKLDVIKLSVELVIDAAVSHIRIDSQRFAVVAVLMKYKVKIIIVWHTNNGIDIITVSDDGRLRDIVLKPFAEFTVVFHGSHLTI